MTVAAEPICDPNLRRMLLHRIHRRFATKTEILELGSLELEFTRVADPNAVLDAAANEEARGANTPSVPYWAQLWESSGAVANLLARRDLHGLRVLDLGCGMGLAGAAAAARGAQVLLADLEPSALLFARLNTLPFASARIRRVHWQTDHLGETFDLILGADILYELKQWPYLDQFWRRHLKESGEILLGEPGRQSGAAFVEWIQTRDWQIDQAQEINTVGEERTIRIFRLRPTR